MNYRGKHGEINLKCLNPQMEDPHHRRMKKNEADVLLSYCVYHNPFCIGDHDGDMKVTIKFPNKETLCTNCYMGKNNAQPPKVPDVRTPGVVNAQTGKPLGDTSQQERLSGSEEDVPYCSWKPDKEEALTEKRGFVCRNKCYRDPSTKILFSTCPMHIKKCVKTHSGDDGKVDVPNIYGMCTMHHIAEHGEPPLDIPFPYPGMERRLKSKGWKIKPGHMFAPTWPRKDDIVYRAQYIAPPQPKSFIEKIRVQAKINEYNK